MVLNVNQWLLHNMFPECLVNSIWKTIWNKSTLVISNMVGPEAKITISNRVSSSDIPNRCYIQQSEFPTISDRVSSLPSLTGCVPGHLLEDEFPII